MDTNLFLRLAEPFPADDLCCRPGATHGNRALALFYIDARSVMDRLDSVLGPWNWQDSYEVVEGGEVLCKLSVRMPDGAWITKMDVGSPSGSDPADRLKGGFSDALKRAAVKFGVGRYLYNIPGIWFAAGGLWCRAASSRRDSGERREGEKMRRTPVHVTSEGKQNLPKDRRAQPRLPRPAAASKPSEALCHGADTLS